MVLPFREADLFEEFSSQGFVEKSGDRISIHLKDFPVIIGSHDGITGVRKGSARVDIRAGKNSQVLVITESGVSSNRIFLDEVSRQGLESLQEDVVVTYTTEEPRIRGFTGGEREFVFEYLNGEQNTEEKQEKIKKQEPKKEKSPLKKRDPFCIPSEILVDVLVEEEVVVENLLSLLEIPISESGGVKKNEIERLFTGLYDSRTIASLKREYGDSREMLLLDRIEKNGFELLSQINQSATNATGWLTELEIANALGISIRQVRLLLFSMCPDGYSENLGVRHNDFERAVVFEYGTGADNVFRVLNYEEEEIKQLHEKWDGAEGVKFYGFRDYTTRQLSLLGLDDKTVEEMRKKHGNKIPGYHVAKILEKRRDYGSLFKLGYYRAKGETEERFRMSLPNTLIGEEWLYHDLKNRMEALTAVDD